MSQGITNAAARIKSGAALPPLLDPPYSPTIAATAGNRSSGRRKSSAPKASSSRRITCRSQGAVAVLDEAFHGDAKGPLLGADDAVVGQNAVSLVQASDDNPLAPGPPRQRTSCAERRRAFPLRPRQCALGLRRPRRCGLQLEPSSASDAKRTTSNRLRLDVKAARAASLLTGGTPPNLADARSRRRGSGPRTSPSPPAGATAR
jgi:hypothetical protein